MTMWTRGTMAAVDRYWIWTALVGSSAAALAWGPMPKDPPPPPKPWTPRYEPAETTVLAALSLNQILRVESDENVENSCNAETIDASSGSPDTVTLGAPIISLFERGDSFSLGCDGPLLSNEGTLLAVDRLFTRLDSGMLRNPAMGGGFCALARLQAAGRTDVALHLEGSLVPAAFVADLEHLSRQHGFRVVIYRRDIWMGFFAAEYVETLAADVWNARR